LVAAFLDSRAELEGFDRIYPEYAIAEKMQKSREMIKPKLKESILRK
jgi:hypothetical protein